jgi:cytochrome c oxidase accessory protein FixG
MLDTSDRTEAAELSTPLYADRVRVYPQAVRGRVRRVKWAVLILCLAVYYLLPWLRWDRGPGQPDQAVLVDMTHGRLFFFWIEIWPQEVYYLTGLLVLGAVALFAATSLFGRVWCGFACPQTVWTDLFMLVERLIEGDRNARMRRDRQPRWSWSDRARKLAKHAAWLMIAALTGGAWVMYFDDAPSLVGQALAGEVPSAVAGFFGLFTATTYLLAGWAREQVCTYMCPWPRFQAAMLDADSLVVSYRAWRGEPRGKMRATGAGDCVDCRACVHVCPTGVDIREGLQMSCIGCGLCIDACDGVMAKLGRPEGLIAFETLNNLAASEAATLALPPGAARRGPGMVARRQPRLLRMRTLLYAAILAVVAGTMLAGLVLRQPVALEVLRDRAPLFVRLSDGSLRNSYTLKLSDRRHEAAILAVAVEGLPARTRLQVLGTEAEDAAGHPLVTTRPDGIAEWRLLVTVPAGALPSRDGTDIAFRLLDPAGGHVLASERSVFLGPKP